MQFTVKEEVLRNTTWDVNGIQKDGGFWPGSNATLVGHNFGCPITNSSANSEDGWFLEFNCRKDFVI